MPPAFVNDPTQPDMGMFEKLAFEMLWNWTGRIFGVSQDTVRPCKTIKPVVPPSSSYEGMGPWPINPGFGSGHSVVGWWGVGAWMPVLVGGNWYNIQCGSCQATNGSCHCDAPSATAISLMGPIQSIDSVNIAGTPLSPSAYWIRDGRFLQRSDGNSWALPQDLTQPAGAPNTWAVTWTHGLPVPEGGALVAGLLASELAKAWASDASCALPSRLQSLHREGIQIMLPRENMGRGAVNSRSSSDQLPKADTGIWMIDNWVNSVNVPRFSVSVRSVDGPQTAGGWTY
jgi:hypothetical protein